MNITDDEVKAVLVGLLEHPHVSLGDLVYQVRDRELLGWDGPQVLAWDRAVTAAKDLLEKLRGKEICE